MTSSSSSTRRSRKAASLSHVYYANAVYFPNHHIYNGESPGALNYSCVNTVFYCFASIAPDGGVYVRRHDPQPLVARCHPLTMRNS